MCSGGTLEVQNAGNKFANGDAQMAPEATFEAAVILSAAEEIAHELAEDGAAVHELDHVGGDGSAEERAAIEAAHDTSGEFEFAGEGGFDPRHVFFGAALGEGLAEQFAGAHGVEEAFAGERIDPGGGVSDERPILAENGAIGKRALLRRRKDVAVKFCVFSGDAVFFDKRAQVRF